VLSTHLVTELSDLSIPARPISLGERQTGCVSSPMSEDSAESNASSQRSAELKYKNIKTTNKKRIEYTILEKELPSQ